jgi:PHP family Zn ribbon phosphoesterase
MLADRPEGYVPENSIPYKNLIPLEEIIAEAMGVGRETVGVKNEYQRLCRIFGSEFEVLLNTPLEELRNNTQERIALGIEKARRGEVIIKPGYDGEFGVIKLFEEKSPTGAQLGLF